MDYLFLLGRILYGGFFVYAGINHFRHLAMMSQFAGMKGVPSAKAAVMFSGLLILVGGACIVLGCAPTWFGVLCIELFLVPVTLLMHNFWIEKDPMGRINQRVNFEKNVALAGAALMLLAIPQPWPISLAW
jgi:putative oxidoreductase